VATVERDEAGQRRQGRVNEIERRKVLLRDTVVAQNPPAERLFLAASRRESASRVAEACGNISAACPATSPPRYSG
jgi:hypothetical protein